SRKPFCVKFAKLVLVIVIIGRAKNRSAHAALRDERINAFWRIGRRAFSLVKRAEMFVENVRDRFVFRKPKRIVERAKKKRLNNFVVLFYDFELHHLPLWFLQNEFGNFKQRIGAARYFDLTGE